MLPWSSLQAARLNPNGPFKRSIRVFSRLQDALYIVYFFFVGIFLLCLPWLWIWENNYVLYLYPQLRPLVANYFFKGAVLGLGIVNIMIGIQDIVHVRRNLRRHR